MQPANSIFRRFFIFSLAMRRDKYLKPKPGDDDREDVSATFLQPFLAYVTPTQTTFGLNAESTYDWQSDQWSVPINLTVAQLLKIGGLPVQVSAGIRYWADAPENGPEDWGARVQLTFLFPK